MSEIKRLPPELFEKRYAGLRAFYVDNGEELGRPDRDLVRKYAHGDDEDADLCWMMAEVEALRAELKEQRELATEAVVALQSPTLAALRDERDDLQARLLVMTQERDTEREAHAVTETRRGKMEGYLQMANNTSKRRGAQRDEYKARAEAAEAQREELAAALEHLRNPETIAVALWHRLAEMRFAPRSPSEWASVLADAFERIALPTSEAVNVQRKQWEAKGAADEYARLLKMINEFSPEVSEPDGGLRTVLRQLCLREQADALREAADMFGDQPGVRETLIATALNRWGDKDPPNDDADEDPELSLCDACGQMRRGVFGGVCWECEEK